MSTETLKADARPSFQFYPNDWLSEPGLRVCSLEAKGLWIEIMCIAQKNSKRGLLQANGQHISNKQLAKAVGETEEKVNTVIAELENAKVFSRLDDSTIYCRRMYREWLHETNIKEARSKAGKASAASRWGNKSKTKVTASTSTSTSTSTSEKTTPAPARPREATDPAASAPLDSETPTEPESKEPKPKQMPRRKPPTQLEVAQAESILAHYRAVIKSAHTARKPAIRNIVFTLRGKNSGSPADPEDLKCAATAYGADCDAKRTEASYRIKDANFYGLDDPWEDWLAAGHVVENRTRRQTPEEIKVNSDRIVAQFNSWPTGKPKTGEAGENES